MPRVRLATQSQIETYITLLKGAAMSMSGTRNPCEDVRVARENLEFFSAFRDKAFKAFYARKILQLPPVIAAQVFDVSNGLISQAAGDRNVYSAANAQNSSSNELGVFNLPGGGVVATTMNNDERRDIFKAFARIAIIKNRGVDVPNFQNRMVAGYMSESDADAFRAGMQTIASVYANCPQMQEGSSMQPEATASQPEINGGLQYRQTNMIPLSQGARGQVILDLITAGADRDQATRLMRELLDLGFNLTIPSRSGNEVSYRLRYYGQMSDAPSSADVLAMIVSGLNLSSTDVSMGLRGEDLAGTITFSRQSAATPPSQPESTANPVLEYTRLMQELGYSEMDTSTILNAINSAELIIVNCVNDIGGIRMKLRSPRDTFGVIQVRQIFRLEWQRMRDREGGVSGRGNRPSVAVSAEPNVYIVQIARPQTYGLRSHQSSTQSAEPQSTTTQRRNIFTDPILASRTINWFRNNGYADTYDDFFELVSGTPTAMITVQDESPQSLKITVATTDGSQVPARDMKAFLAGPRGSDNQRVRYGQIDYTLNGMRTSATWRILPFDSGYESSTASTASTAPQQTLAGANDLRQEYENSSSRFQAGISLTDYRKFRSSGYSRADVQALVREIQRYGLRIRSIDVRRASGQMPQNLRLDVVGRDSSARTFRNGTFLNFLRSRLRSIGSTDAEVQVLSPRGRPYQSATFRGTGRGQTPVGALIIPMGNEEAQISGSAPQATSTPQASQEIDPQGDPGVAGESNPTASTAPPTRTRTRNVKLNRSIGIEIEGDMPFAREAGMSITEYFKLRMRQWCADNGQPQLKVGSGMDKYTFGGDGSVSGAVPFEVDSPALVPANIDPATTSLPASFIEDNKFVSDQVLWNQIRTFCESLRYSGVRVHKSAGLHIHISVADYTPQDFERYVYNYASLEPLIDLAMTANSRGPGRAYSGSLVTSGRITTGWGRGNSVSRSTPEEAARAAQSIGRKKIRTTTGIQTIEFRHPMTTIDYDDIKNFTLLHFYLVTVSKRKKLQRTNFKGLMNILPVDVATYFYNRIETMDMKTPDYNFFTGTRGQDSALQKSGDTSEGVRQANLPREDYT